MERREQCPPNIDQNTKSPFHNIDKRLEKYGIEVEHRGAVTSLIGPFGTLLATAEGSSTHFERALAVDTHAVIDALEIEYGTKIVDENDHRFWGFSSREEMEQRIWPLDQVENRKCRLALMHWEQPLLDREAFLPG